MAADEICIAALCLNDIPVSENKKAPTNCDRIVSGRHSSMCHSDKKKKSCVIFVRQWFSAQNKMGRVAAFQSSEY